MHNHISTLLGLLKSGSFVLLISLLINTSALQAMSVADESLADEQYDHALGLIIQQHYSDALVSLRRLQRDYPQFSKIALVQTRIAVLHEASTAGESIAVYLDALNQRDDADADGALQTLDQLLMDYPDTSLRDDALYLKAYIEIMVRFEFDNARHTLSQLMMEFVDGAYQDSAQYLDGIALEQLGDTSSAVTQFEALRDRHTAASLPLGFKWPKDTVLSRYWYDRADKRLNMLKLQQTNASVVRSAKKNISDGHLQVEVSVAGREWQLVLWPSSMVKETSWLDGSFSDSAPPQIAFYEGEVVGTGDSWVRAVINDGVISGVFDADGIEYKMETESLLGTLDYYQPLSEKRRSLRRPDSTSAHAALGTDTLSIPGQSTMSLHSRLKEMRSDIQVVPLSIVVDNEFDRYYGGQGLAVALNELIVADGIYRKFNLALTLDKVQVFGQGDYDPVIEGPATLETYLRSFREYRLDQKSLFSDSVLNYLFTGKDHTDLNLGVAWIGGVCRSDGYDVGITTPSVIGGLLLSHELAHSLGAVHDDVTDCKSETYKLMWPYLSSDTKSIFSECSEKNLSGANSKSCLVNGVDVDVSVSGDINEVVISLTNPDSVLSVNGVLKLETSTLDALLLDDICSVSTSAGGECVIQDLAPKETREIIIALNSSVVDAQTIVSAEMTSMDIFDYSKKNNQVEYSVLSGKNIHDEVDSAQIVDEVNESSGGGGGSLWMMLIILLSFATFCQYRQSEQRVVIAKSVNR